MQELMAAAAVVAALLVGVVSPGPSFLMVARTAVASSRAEGLAAALGMGLGGLLFGALALAGLQGLLHAVPALYVALKLVGGLYLCWLGWRIFRAAEQPLPAAAAVASGGFVRALRQGLLTQVSNPKTAVVYASMFAAFLPPQVTPLLALLLLAGVFLVEAGWYALVALALSAAAPQRAYLAGKRWFDRAAGAVMVGLGLRLASTAVRP
jgi:threonine/homoserine/homoserine lactone efflux protein